MTTTDPKRNDTASSDDDLPPLEEQKQESTNAAEIPSDMSAMPPQFPSAAKKRASKAEKRIKKAMQKLNLKEFDGVARVSIRQAKLLFTIHQPEVYEIADNSYLIFGEAKIDNMQKRPQLDMLQNVLAQAQGAQKDQSASSSEENNASTSDDVEVDESGLDSNDLELVMSQAQVSRQQAAKALLDNDKDIVKSILALTQDA